MDSSAHSIFATPVVISDPATLRSHFKSRSRELGRPLILNFPGMLPAEAHAASERLNKAGNECGCSAGATAMLVVFAISLVAIGAIYGPFNGAALVRLPLAFAAAFGAAGLGKALAIARAHRRARNEVAHILATFGNRT